MGPCYKRAPVDARDDSAVVVLAGGGTGGHIYPNVAIAERLGGGLGPHFLVSNRPGDSATMTKLGLPFSTSSVRPLPPIARPWRALGFYVAWRRAIAEAVALLQRERVRAVVATGGFVSGPALVAARRLGLPRAMVNLDAVPGKANRRLHRDCTKVFTAYPSPLLPGAEHVGFPLRKISQADGDVAGARARLGLAPDRPTLFVTGATHGAESIIRAMTAIVGDAARVRAFADWQVLHQCGGFDPQALQRVYDDAGVTARVVAYLDRMGDAWGAADLAVSRAGAGSVAEAWANATPTIFLPNPYHADGHQRANAQPMAEAGGATIVVDAIDPVRNLEGFGRELQTLLGDAVRRRAMRDAALRSRPPDGAAAVAAWLAEVVTGDVRRSA